MGSRTNISALLALAAVPLVLGVLVACDVSPRVMGGVLIAFTLAFVVVAVVRASGQSPDDDETQAFDAGTDGRVAGVQADIEPTTLSTSVDLLRLKTLQDALMEQNARMHIAVRAAGAGVWDWNLISGKIQWSDLALEIFGIEPGTVISPDVWRSSVLEDDLPLAETLMQEAIESGSQFDVSFRIRRRGEIRWVQVHATVIRNESRYAVRVVGVYIDITSRVASDDHRREIARRLQKVAQHLPGFVFQFRLSPDGASSFPYASAGIQDTYGCTPAQAAADASRIFEIIHPSDLGKFHSAIRESAAKLSPWKLEYRVKTSDGGYRWLMGSSVPEREADGGTLWHGFITDITESRQRQEELAHAREAADAASKAKSEFLANMSHELRTPMTAILGFVDLLDDASTNATTRSEYVYTIKRNSEHLITVINDILDLSKIEAGKMVIEPTNVDPVKITSDVCSIMGFRASSKKIDLTLDYDSPLPRTIRTDGLRLRQILINLIGNAVKFTDVGSVRVRISFEQVENTPNTLTISVQDTGIGIAANVLPTLFTAFQQADSSTTRRFGGTGLGLQISKRLAEMLGGNISVTSTAGEGSEFCLSLPLTELECSNVVRRLPGRPDSQWPAPPLKATEVTDVVATVETVGAESLKTTAEPPLKGRRVLLAEDGLDNQRLISFHLRKAGAEVRIAGNGLAAMEALNETGTPSAPGFDLVVMDMQMPELDGYGATRRLRHEQWRLPVIALTAHAMQGDRDKCLAAGCDEYTTKPIDRATLISMCATLIQTFERAIVPGAASIAGAEEVAQAS